MLFCQGNLLQSEEGLEWKFVSHMSSKNRTNWSTGSELGGPFELVKPKGLVRGSHQFSWSLGISIRSVLQKSPEPEPHSFIQKVLLFPVTLSSQSHENLPSKKAMEKESTLSSSSSSSIPQTKWVPKTTLFLFHSFPSNKTSLCLVLFFGLFGDRKPPISLELESIYGWTSANVAVTNYKPVKTPRKKRNSSW